MLTVFANIQIQSIILWISVDCKKGFNQIGHIKIEIWVAVNGVFWNQVNSITG